MFEGASLKESPFIFIGGRKKFMSMLEKRLQELVEQYLEGTSLFLTGIKVKQGNVIIITIDSDTSVSISDCEQLHRHLQKQLGSDIYNFELTVSSHGLNNPLVVPRQFKKYTGKQLSIRTHSGQKVKGKLIMADEHHIVIETFDVADKKRVISKELSIPYTEIARALPLIEF